MSVVKEGDMACSALHLLIAEEYCKRHGIEQVDTFLTGAILPDIQQDKVSSHYGVKKRPTSVKEALEYKIDIVKCVESIDFNKDSDRSVFLHLLTDYIYYNYLYKESLEVSNMAKLIKDIDNDAGVMTNEILAKYSFNIPEEFNYLLVPKRNNGSYVLFPEDKVDNFVEVLSTMDLDQAKNEIIVNANDFIANCLNKINNSENVSVG